MISIPLFKRTIKSNIKLWGILTGVLMFLVVAVFGAAKTMGNAGSIMINQYYMMFAAVIPLIYIAITANKLIAAQVDSGSFAYVMSNPIKRSTVSLTQGLFLAGSLVATYLLITITGLISLLAFGKAISFGDFFLLNLGSLLLNLAISGIGFFASCFFNQSSKAMAVGAGIPVAFFILRLVSDLEAFSENMKYFKYFTLNTLFNFSDITAHSTNLIWQFLILFAVAAVGYAAGVFVFKKKDLPL